ATVELGGLGESALRADLGERVHLTVEVLDLPDCVLGDLRGRELPLADPAGELSDCRASEVHGPGHYGATSPGAAVVGSVQARNSSCGTSHASVPSGHSAPGDAWATMRPSFGSTA